eukprot:TRINITY_DN109543_c0_g1_i1.p1 TRINITY_DN109543_c0_g1~~TRINITY_DN109543_c0_g1_i1.p1  ORF type:complete len:419 (+),score=82.63 TRINITY_DN109543_c0_g1_i1:618-1874(+)
MQSKVQALVAAVQTACKNGSALLLVEAAARSNEEEETAAACLSKALGDVQGCSCIHWDDLRTLYPSAEEDPYAATCAMIIRRALATPLREVLKVFVADCDHTLWDGAVAEDGVQGLGLSGPHLDLQQKLAKLQQSGRLICLASRNACDADVLRVFEERGSECLIKKEQLVAWEVHLGPKPQSLRRLSEMLNLNLKNFVFLDDNPFEIEAVKTQLPEVLALQVPAQPQAFMELLQHSWALDPWGGAPTTKEDGQRTELYRQNAERRAERLKHTSLETFLKSVQVEVEVREPYPSETPRLSQLSQRTNQFNTNSSKFRFSEERVQSWAAGDDRFIMATQVVDKFGDYGLVAAAFCTRAQDMLVIDCLAMSCRVLFRGVEQSLLRRLAELAVSEGRSSVSIPFHVSGRNDLARGFLSRVKV